LFFTLQSSFSPKVEQLWGLLSFRVAYLRIFSIHRPFFVNGKCLIVVLDWEYFGASSDNGLIFGVSTQIFLTTNRTKSCYFEDTCIIYGSWGFINLIILFSFVDFDCSGEDKEMN
jgi:hypothetical protein